MGPITFKLPQSPSTVNKAETARNAHRPTAISEPQVVEHRLYSFGGYKSENERDEEGKGGKSRGEAGF